MLSIEEAQRTILARIPLLETEKVSVVQGLNRVTPEDHVAPWDIPPADNSAMDGYAFRHATLSDNRLSVAGFLPAGAVCTAAVPPGGAIKIMTGAPAPPRLRYGGAHRRCRCGGGAPPPHVRDRGGSKHPEAGGGHPSRRRDHLRRFAAPAAGDRHAVGHGDDVRRSLPPRPGIRAPAVFHRWFRGTA